MINYLKKIYYEKYSKKSYSLSNVDLIIERIFTKKNIKLAPNMSVYCIRYRVRVVKYIFLISIWFRPLIFKSCRYRN